MSGEIPETSKKTMDLILVEDDSGSDMENGVRKLMAITAMKEDKLYVALGKEVKQYETLLSWAIQNSGCHKICILHVHQPENFIPICNFLLFPFIKFISRNKNLVGLDYMGCG